MKINIHALAGALFHGVPQCLDMDSGAIVPLYLVENGTLCVQRPMVLPLYSNSPIYQQYLDRIFAENDIEDEYVLRNYPRFELHTFTSPGEWYEKYADEEKYVHDAYHFLYDLKLEGHTYDDDNFAEIAGFQDFEEQFTVDFARRWCAENGFEWYEPEDKSKSFNDTLRAFGESELK